MVSKNIVIKMFMNTSFNCIPSLAQESYGSVIA